MKIDIIGTVEEEVTLLHDRAEDRQTISLGGHEICTSWPNGTKAVLLKSDIGRVAATLGAILLLEHYKPDMIISTGSAGDLAPTLKMDDIVVSGEARYHDMDVMAFGYKYGRSPSCLAGFKAGDKLIAATEVCIAGLNLNAVHGLIISGDAFINGSVDLAKICHSFSQVIAVEMEATVITYTCHNFNVPFIIVRTIFDVVDRQSHLSLSESLAVAAKQFNLMVESLTQKLTHS